MFFGGSEWRRAQKHQGTKARCFNTEVKLKSYNLDTDYNLRISQAAGLAETELLRQGEQELKLGQVYKCHRKELSLFFLTYHSGSLKALSRETMTYNKNYECKLAVQNENKNKIKLLQLYYQIIQAQVDLIKMKELYIFILGNSNKEDS